MKDVTIRTRDDGLIELSPKLAPLDPLDRWLVIVTVLMAAFGFFVCGAMPVEALAAITAFCVAGDVFLGVKAAVLALLRPAAEIHEVSRLGPIRGH